MPSPVFRRSVLEFGNAIDQSREIFLAERSSKAQQNGFLRDFLRSVARLSSVIGRPRSQETPPRGALTSALTQRSDFWQKSYPVVPIGLSAAGAAADATFLFTRGSHRPHHGSRPRRGPPRRAPRSQWAGPRSSAPSPVFSTQQRTSRRRRIPRRTPSRRWGC